MVKAIIRVFGIGSIFFIVSLHFSLVFAGSQLTDFAKEIDMQLIDLPEKAPSFYLRDLNHEWESLDTYQGKVIFLSIWATWCGVCRMSMPKLNQLYSAFKTEDFIVLGISTDQADNESNVYQFVKDNNIVYPILLDPDNATAQAYQANALPTTVVINDQGRMLGVMYGYREWDSDNMKQFVRYLLETGSTQQPNGFWKARTKILIGSCIVIIILIMILLYKRMTHNQ